MTKSRRTLARCAASVFFTSVPSLSWQIIFCFLSRRNLPVLYIPQQRAFRLPQAVASYGCASQSGELCPLPPGGWDADPSSSAQIGLGAEILPRCPETCRECPGWEGDARAMWGIVWLTSVTSPLCVWACLPYLRGRQSGALIEKRTQKRTHTHARTHTRAVFDDPPPAVKTGSGQTHNVIICNASRAVHLQR
eukprot:COSAG06_NODE_3275_length_5577_cov_6.602410_3_plen_193_part_00